MVMDDMFGHLALPDLPIDLEELEFDFEEMNDFGPWIETDVNNQLGFDLNHSTIESDCFNFKDLEIKEAVRYDCMWSSYNEFSSQKVKSNDSSTLSNSFYDSLLQSIDTPSCSETDTSSIKSEMDTDEEIDITSEKKIHKDNNDTFSNHTNSFQSSAQLFASLDHCYNISSTHLDNEKYMVKNNGPMTPPASSDEEDSQTTFSYNLNTHPRKNRSAIKTKHNLNKVQSLLKKSQQKPSNEAKFSFKVILKTDKSRSLLKQKIKIIRTPFKTDAESQIKQRLLEHQKLETCQS